MEERKPNIDTFGGWSAFDNGCTLARLICKTRTMRKDRMSYSRWLFDSQVSDWKYFREREGI